MLSRSANCLLKRRSRLLQGVMTMSDAMMIPPALIVPGSMAPPALPVQVGPERSPAWAHDVQGVGGSPCGGALWGEGLYVLPLAWGMCEGAAAAARRCVHADAASQRAG